MLGSPERGRGDLATRRSSMRLIPAVISPPPATAMAFVVVAPAEQPGPQIRLVDHTVAMDPPAVPGDGSLPDGDTLTPFDVQDPAGGRLDPAFVSAVQNAATSAAAQG